MLTLKRNLILFFFLFTNTQIVFGQDTIFYSNGNKEIIEMMQISGDTIQFRIDTLVQKVATNKVMKIRYQNGNRNDFEIPKPKLLKPKASLLVGYPDLPLVYDQGKYFLNNFPLTNKEFDEIMQIQRDDQIQKKFMKYVNINNAKTLLIGISILGVALPLGHVLVDRKTAIDNLSRGVNANSRYIVAGVWAASVCFSIALHNSSQANKKELFQLYNTTYYK